MFRLRFTPGQEPRYMTEHSAAADLCSSEDCILASGKVIAVPTGVWIDEVLWEQVPTGTIPELQIRARSGLAVRNQVALANGVGTVDADFRNEICVLLMNFGDQEFQIRKGDRIAQVVMNLVHRIPGLDAGTQRLGGFGSTGVSAQSETVI